MKGDEQRSRSSWVVWVLSGLAGLGIVLLLRLVVDGGSSVLTEGAGVGDPVALPDVLLVPAGDFLAGCHEKVDSECLDSEEPEKIRSLAAFSIDRTEVTVAAYRACVDTRSCSEPNTGGACNWGVPDRDRHPVNCVDWSQAAAYCAWRGARLPTEWEWEKAARGTEGDKYPWGNEPADCSRAVIDDGSGNACGSGDTTFEVASKPAGTSPYGAFDMIGNVWEWTSTTPDGTIARVVRGGAYYVEPPHARASFSLRFVPTGRADFVGFRCAR